MKSPAELKAILRRQWESAAKREARLLCDAGAESWPLIASIGRPPPGTVATDLDRVKRHVEAWRRIRVGEVVWEPVRYRAVAHPVEMPILWKLHRPTEWVAACADRTMREEFERMSGFVEQTDACFHSLLVRQRSLWRDKSLEEVLQAARVASLLEPNYAQGKPLRALSLDGTDTKFFERNARLVTALLDVRFDGEVSRIGLAPFLGAVSEGDHWLLVIDLDGSLLPFQKQRVRSSELRRSPLPGERLLIVENESCQHQLPLLPETIAILGTGFDLDWTQGTSLPAKQIGYWGDIDTWGLQLLATARQSLPHLDALLMTPETFERNIEMAVPEPVIAGTEIPVALNAVEAALYRRLLSEPRGRLEQEFLPPATIGEVLREWAGGG